jgi:Fe/S biogenesis protein NfuA
MDDADTATVPADQAASERDGGPADASADGAVTSSPASVPLRVTDAALDQVLSILGAEPDPEALGLRIEVTGTRGVEYAYDLSLEERSEAAADDLIYNQGDLVVMIPADSVDPLWGATLDLPSSAGQSGLVIRNPNRPDPLSDFDIELSGTVSERIQQLLDQQINPALAAHGGFASLVEVVEATDGAAGARAVVTMGGGCQGCAVSAVTLREGIQKAILEHIPEVAEVVDVTDHDAGDNPFYT